MEIEGNRGVAEQFVSTKEDFAQSLHEFILTELETGIVFASVAIDSTSEEKRRRNCQNARKAYDTARCFWRKHPAPEHADQKLRLQSRRLEELLLALGEDLEKQDDFGAA